MCATLKKGGTDHHPGETTDFKPNRYLESETSDFQDALLSSQSNAHKNTEKYVCAKENDEKAHKKVNFAAESNTGPRNGSQAADKRANSDYRPGKALRKPCESSGDADRLDHDLHTGGIAKTRGKAEKI